MLRQLILLADDDIDDRDLFSEALENIDRGISCMSVVNGNQLLITLAGLKDTPQLIFMDLNMPMLSGLECLQLIKQNPRYLDIPVVIISTSSNLPEMESAIHLGALCYLTKPSNFNELKAALQVIVANPHARLATIIGDSRSLSKSIYMKGSKK